MHKIWSSPRRGAAKIFNQNKKWIALLLSGFLLPGLGQVHLGNRKKGWMFILLSFSTLILTFSKYMMGLLKVAQIHPHSRFIYSQISKSLIEAFWLEKVWIFAGISSLLLIWIWGILDIGLTKRDEPLL